MEALLSRLRDGVPAGELVPGVRALLVACSFLPVVAGLSPACADPASSSSPTHHSMQLTITREYAEFLGPGEVVAGRYNQTDAFKPHLHPLRSPRGHVISLVSPHDHKHHKGLMYALRVPDLNFWEETSTLPGEVVGRQRHIAFADVCASGDEVGFTETLSWEPAQGGSAVFTETRRISCRREGEAFVWTWQATLLVQRATRLVQSQWSFKKADGQRINYHGLGLRFRRDFGGGTRNNALQLDSGPVRWNRNASPFDVTTAMGATPRTVTFIGSIDGSWPVAQVAVSLAQQQENGLFIMEVPFAFLALGPSNLGEVPLQAGDTLHEHYTVTVADVVLDAG